VLEALEPIELRWGSELSDLDLAVDEVPEVVETSPDDVVWGAGVLADVGCRSPSSCPRASARRPAVAGAHRALPAAAGKPGRGGADLADLLHEVLVEQVAEYLNIEPDAVDGGPV
jgi:hypothetical protein